MTDRSSSFAAPRRRAALFAAAVTVTAAAAALWYLAPRFESTPPQIVIAPAGAAIGQTPLEVRISDAGSGLKSVTVTLVQGGTEYKLAAETFAQPARDKTLTLALAKAPGIREGPAVLKVTARDAALWRGNPAAAEQPLVLDFTPPTLQLVADDRYLNFGGVGVLVYKTSADAVKTGVQFGTRFFPGIAGPVAGQPDARVVLFAHAYDMPADARPKLMAQDAAGNTRELALAYELKDVKYRKSTIAISEPFLRDKVAPLLADAAARQGAPQDVFIAVNRGLRQANEAQIAALTGPATPQRLWQGAFLQLPNSKVEANFADARTYTWNGSAIDTALHLGYDLSVTRAYPVPAANAGNVVFAGDLGIYGGTVIVDHGLGLYTLYSHLSAMAVRAGDTVARQQLLGKTGETGLAAGDHLHYGVYVSGVAVLPVEWWDAKWLDENMTAKLEGRSARAGTPAPATKAATRKAAAKKRH